MTLRIVDDEDARAATGYDATLAPRGPRIATGPTHWAIVERPGKAPAGAAAEATRNVCRACNEPSSVLHADPDSSAPHRVLCSRCTGDKMRARIGWATAAEPTDKRGGR